MSSVDSEVLVTCAACGASVYREHVHRGLAGMWGGQMLCPACLKPKREGVAPPAAPETGSSIPLAAPEAPAAPPSEESPAAAPETETMEPATEESSGTTGTGARHVQTFHAKLSEAALRHMDDQINNWLKHHPRIEVKFANTTVGVFEGKHSEPNLIVTLFY